MRYERPQEKDARVRLFDYMEVFYNRQSHSAGVRPCSHRPQPGAAAADPKRPLTHGVLAPNAKLRSQIVPAPPERASEPPTDHASAQGETPRMSWARLLKRVFDIDVEHCPNCGGALKIIAAPSTGSGQA